MRSLVGGILKPKTPATRGEYGRMAATRLSLPSKTPATRGEYDIDGPPTYQVSLKPPLPAGNTMATKSLASRLL